jgi:hypothetical protein
VETGVLNSDLKIDTEGMDTENVTHSTVPDQKGVLHLEIIDCRCNRHVPETDIQSLFSSSPTQKSLRSIRHIESLDACMEH